MFFFLNIWSHFLWPRFKSLVSYMFFFTNLVPPCLYVPRSFPLSLKRFILKLKGNHVIYDLAFLALQVNQIHLHFLFQICTINREASNPNVSSSISHFLSFLVFSQEKEGWKMVVSAILDCVVPSSSSSQVVDYAGGWPSMEKPKSKSSKSSRLQSWSFTSLLTPTTLACSGWVNCLRSEMEFCFHLQFDEWFAITSYKNIVCNERAIFDWMLGMFDAMKLITSNQTRHGTLVWKFRN